MQKFEVGKIYDDGDDIEKIEIRVVKRTPNTITFVYTKKNWWEKNIEREYRKKIRRYHVDAESIRLGNNWSSPSIVA